MNTYTQAQFSKFELIVMEADIIRGRECKAQQPVNNSYAVANGAGIELLSQAIEYGIEGDCLDARIEQWRADSPVANNEAALIESVEQAVADLGKAYSNRRPVYKGSRFFFYLAQPKPTYAQLKAAVGTKGFVHPKSLEITRYNSFGLSWRKPNAMRIARAQASVMAKNGELEGKAEYLSRLSQYDVHPDFGGWIHTWIEEHLPINRKGLAPGVSFAKDPQAPVAYVTQPEQPWKIPAAQVVEHWQTDARLMAFEPCKDKKKFASHVREFWSQVDTAQAEGQKLLVLLPAAVYSYRFGGKGKRKA